MENYLPFEIKYFIYCLEKYECSKEIKIDLFLYLINYLKR